MTNPEDVRKGLTALSITSNMAALQIKLEREEEKNPKNLYEINKLKFQIAACKKGLSKCQA